MVGFYNDLCSLLILFVDVGGKLEVVKGLAEGGGKRGDLAVGGVELAVESLILLRLEFLLL